MSLSKKLLKHPRTLRLLSYLLAGYIRLVFATSRITRHYDNASQHFMQGKENAIFAIWHGRIMMMPSICPTILPMHVLISFHRDGALISNIIRHFNLSTISGSTSRGGGTALRQMLRRLASGHNVTITPDGPRGPREQLSPGTITLARLSGKPVLPVTFSASRHVRLKSWDRFMLALPFGHIAFYVGAPIMLPRNQDAIPDDALRLEIEHAMNQLTEKADRGMGV